MTLPPELDPLPPWVNLPSPYFPSREPRWREEVHRAASSAHSGPTAISIENSSVTIDDVRIYGFATGVKVRGDSTLRARDSLIMGTPTAFDVGTEPGPEIDIEGVTHHP